MKHPLKPLLYFLVFTLNICLQAQDNPFQVPATNSHSKVQQRLAATDIEISYNRPSVKGRLVFGELVPYGQVWRTGSDASTKISFSTPVFINGHRLEAGTYELFTIPNKDEWTVIFQENRSQWGSYGYDAQFDVLRVKAKPMTQASLVETFNIGFDSVNSSSLAMQIAWEKTLVPIQISVDLKETVVPKLEASLKNPGRKPYFRAAMFYFENDLDISRAAELMSLALEENPGHIGMLYRYALILEEKGNIEEAVKAAQQSLEGAQNASGELKAEYTKLNTELLARIKN